MKVGTPLSDGWTLRLDTSRQAPRQAPEALHRGPLPAAVPGCVHTDLLAAGLIPDPFLDRNETDVAWVGHADWAYRTTLPEEAAAGGHERTELVFEGLDTAATVQLAGRTLGSSRNMHRSYRYDITGCAPGDELTVRFTSAYAEGEAMRALLGDRPSAYSPEPTAHIRKMACSFGWDWGPTLPTAGIWRPVRVERWSTARLERVRPLVGVAPDGTGRVELRLDVARTAAGGDRPLTVRAEVGGRRATAELAPGATAAVLVVEVPEAALWWPRGYGEQARYACTVELADETGPLDSWSRRIGFRTVRLDTAEDARGRGFTLVVNGERIFARGVNWIPDDVFPSRITEARYRERLGQAAAAGVDLVRVWGGGIYESEAFYETCDELGLMVWQDFLFACAAYPEEQPIRGEVEAEARENVVRLMPHPSLVLWNGNNENLWGFRDWGWEPRLAGASWGEGYYLGLLPRIVAETDPTRPYWPGSPWSGSWDHHPNDPGHGNAHSWEVWNRRDYTAYLEEVPRFVAEFGWQAPPAYTTLRRAVSDEPLRADSPGVLHHQKAEDGNGKLERGLAHHFALPAAEDFDRWHYLTQVNQARAVATGVEHWRSHWPACAGTVVWQLNDCWPVTSWAAIDSAARPKPLYHELRRLYADRLLTLQERDGALVLAAVNHSAKPWTTTAVLRRLDAEGGELARVELAVDAAPRSVRLLPVPAEPAAAGDPAREFWCADADGLRALRFAVPDKDFGYPRAAFDIDVVPDGTDGAEITVTAHTLLRDLLLQPDRVDPAATADTGLLTLLPGESAVIRLSGWQPGDPAAAREAVEAALTCVNA